MFVQTKTTSIIVFLLLVKLFLLNIVLQNKSLVKSKNIKYKHFIIMKLQGFVLSFILRVFSNVKIMNFLIRYAKIISTKLFLLFDSYYEKVFTVLALR